MGSRWGHILANIFMASLVTKANKTLTGILLYRRYFSDTLIITQSEELLNELNLLDKDIQVTVETEQYKTNLFLDIVIGGRTDRTISRLVHQKSTWDNQYMHPGSFAPIQSNRATSLCTPDDVQSALFQLTETLKLNGYTKVQCKSQTQDLGGDSTEI
ncbi:unnamed protein product [Echinostoma caproni]|uniref:Reverse transcriptase domain-containing protein n=1 Tax=Echinostoma caproni TaxID=27848 RepID=A0A183A5C9_9TREM|nr:unnamed protein product [Echinostoma caproni]